LVSSRHIKELADKVLGGGFGSKPQASGNKIKFSPLSDSEWSQLREVGTLKVRPIVYASGTSDLTQKGKEQVDSIVKNIDHYPNFRIEIRGHTGTRGDKRMNELLSQDRADSVLRYMDITYGVTPERIRSVGFGGSKPLSRNQGESSRAYNYRLPRVEIVLVTEVI
jgi:outer membrane protein OmpA-like peptidoglycan-associated protein